MISGYERWDVLGYKSTPASGTRLLLAEMGHLSNPLNLRTSQSVPNAVTTGPNWGGGPLKST